MGVLPQHGTASYAAIRRTGKFAAGEPTSLVACVPLRARHKTLFSSPGMAVNLVDLALQCKGGKRPFPFE
jgi:hypothetical protein